MNNAALARTRSPQIGTPPLRFESVQIVYIVQADDHSLNDEHEIEYDLVAGV